MKTDRANSQLDLSFAEQVVREALAGGADQAEVFMKATKSLSVEVKEQAVDSLKSSRGFGYSLRVIREGRLGFSYATEMSDHGAVVRNALDSARYADRDDYLGLPERTEYPEVEVFDSSVELLKEEDAIDRVRALEKSALDEDPRIRRTRKAAGSFTQSETAIVNSRSVSTWYASTGCSAQVMALAEENGESQMGWDFSGSRYLVDISFEEVGKTAARRALGLLGSRKIEKCTADIVLDNSVAVDFLGILASMLSAEAVQKGKSLLAGKMNEQVMSPRIAVIDSALLPHRLGSRPMDDEGVASGEKVLISEGVLLGFLFNTYTARKGGTVSTGNGVRGGFASLPGVGATNFYVRAVSDSDVIPAGRIISALDRGLLVVDVMGLHTANPISGEFSVGVSGIWIEGGAARYPVKEAVISGNILDLFSKVKALGDDLRFYGGTGSPSIIIAGIDISA
jgi:PmbA protein